MLVLDRVAQLGERFQSERFGEIIVSGHGAGRFDRLGGDDEFGVLAGEVLLHVVRRKRHFQRAGFAPGDADKLILEARNECIRSDQDDSIVAGAAFEWLAVDGAGKGNRYAVILGGLFALCARRVRLVLIGDASNALVDFGIGDIRGKLGQLDAFKIGERDRRHDLKRHGVVEIGLAGDQLLYRAFIGRQRDLRIGGKLEAALADDLVVGVAHRRLDHLGHGRAAVHALEVRDRHLARPESVDADAVFQLIQTRIDLGIEFGGGNDHLDIRA